MIDGGEKCKNLFLFLTGGRMLLQSVAMLTTKFLLGDKITACVKQICLLGVICKV